MSYRNLFIENPARISLRNRQLLIETDHIHSVPIEDISALLIESRQSTITTAALSSLGESGVAVYLCDEKHLPCALLTPFSQHSRELSVLKNQLECSEPLKKRLWQKIIQSKILNQAECLKLAGKTEEYKTIVPYAEKVRSGDSLNVESTASMKYFPLLFGKEFTRTNEDILNASLNYGYAILRGCIARNLAVYGFQPVLGLHHHSELNRFNLADDLIEPFRPLIDLMVYSLDDFHGEVFSSDCRKLLFSCLSMEVLSGGQHHSAAYAVEKLVMSLSRSVAYRKPDLCLPELLPLKLHSYE